MRMNERMIKKLIAQVFAHLLALEKNSDTKTKERSLLFGISMLFLSFSTDFLEEMLNFGANTAPFVSGVVFSGICFY